MKQSWLPGLDRPDVADANPANHDLTDWPVATQDGAIPVPPGQMALFTAGHELLGLLYSAIGRGRFEEALEHRDALIAREGLSSDTRSLGLLDLLGASTFWTRRPGEILLDWARLERESSASLVVRALLRDGVFVRLLEAHQPSELAREEPGALAPLVNFLTTAGAPADVDPAVLLRDALLAGITPAPDDFDDPAFVDLLAEERGAAWLACIGAVRHLWAVPPADPSELTLPLPPVPDDDEDRGRRFWACLRRTVACGREESAAIDARKRLKQLDPDLHAQFMRQGVRRE
jgi:hypothetical protein